MGRDPIGLVRATETRSSFRIAMHVCPLVRTVPPRTMRSSYSCTLGVISESQAPTPRWKSIAVSVILMRLSAVASPPGRTGASVTSGTRVTALGSTATRAIRPGSPAR